MKLAAVKVENPYFVSAYTDSVALADYSFLVLSELFPVVEKVIVPDSAAVKILEDHSYPFQVAVHLGDDG